MASASLNKTFPHVDKVCDAPFLKQATGITTKKDTVNFILSNPDCRAFFARLDAEMVESDAIIQSKITKYFTTIPEAIKTFKQSLKVVHEQAKLSKKQAERDALKAEIQREMEAEKIKTAHHAQIRSELDLPAEPIESTIGSTIKTPKPNLLSTTSTTPSNIGSPSFISNDSPSVPAPELKTSSYPGSSGSVDESTENASTPGTSPNESSEMGLDAVFRYFKATLDGGYFKIVSTDGQPINIKTVEFDHQQITLIVETPNSTPSQTSPVINPTVISVPKVSIK